MYYFFPMNKLQDLPSLLPIFPLSNFIFFPNTTVPLNIFEPRYIQMINDSMKGNRMIGMVQPKKNNKSIHDLYEIGCLGKITSFNETDDGRYIILLNGIIRFKTVKEIKTDKLYRQYHINFDDFTDDLNNKKNEIKFSDLELIFKNYKNFFKKKGYIINWKDIEKQSLDQAINTLSMASPFSLEEKQILLECDNLVLRKKKLEEILKNYIFDNFSNTTVQ